ncbi:cupin domain-containing protein [Pseudomonas fluorescens]|uniref:cupin domain-containing protein n=1 Tax=Pseudomonas fluorescens group TaxID=136843 RepID=UPI0015E66B3D|nr:MULTISPECIES: cupin domain-containing protein [Pseudomonas fluorescens group]MBA1430971.1 cupin domain-containing protein [Pseudomonas orientalis]MBD8150167.1 cupin domain-containing protein [Pseudomonas fluorescens]MBD8175975.1 cupin domain-containing protein [Pseudomonas fluorescens]MBD8744861.1 cupin domain-containing protein [Pseudomonas fluorescens]MBD8748647.1 cupin domain-containing protein [Pseudomonas fluorescens]
MKRLLAIASILASLNAYAHEPVYHEETLKVLQEHALANVPGKKTIMLTVDYAPGQATVPHSHTGTAVAYVLEGEITSRVNDEKAITYKAGDSFYEPAGSRHFESSNASQTRPARLLVVMVLDDKAEVLTPLAP